MAVFIVTGKLGSGKTLLAVSRIREYLREGRRVATNLNLRLEKLLPPSNRSAHVVRVSDKPTRSELEALGLGADVLDEERYGVLVLDELGSWLNARTWADKERQGVIDWLIHSRKRRWDVVFIVQHVSMIDKQVREALLEYLVTCRRLDRIRVPLFGTLGRWLTLGFWDGRGPKLHLGLVVYAGGSATLQGALVSDRWFYRGRDLYEAYETEQVFSDAVEGSWSFLTPWHLVGRYLVRRGFVEVLRAELRVFLWSMGLASLPVRPRPPVGRTKALLRVKDVDARWGAARRLVKLGLL
jgi:hypothetical protein